VLEIGCGPGPNIWYLVREGFTVAGIDGSPTAIRQSEERLMADGLPYEKPRVDFKVGNFACLPWADESFDAVVDVEALYANTMTNIRTSVAEVRRTLKPGGVFFGKMFGTQTTGSSSGEMVEAGTMRCPETGPCAGNEIAHFFTREEFNDLFAGFRDLCIDQTTRTDHNGKMQVFEWIVSARK
jgi:ubiquinone/menaquinone biosynthesis C-methylase UbiE